MDKNYKTITSAINVAIENGAMKMNTLVSFADERFIISKLLSELKGEEESKYCLSQDMKEIGEFDGNYVDWILEVIE